MDGSEIMGTLFIPLPFIAMTAYYLTMYTKLPAVLLYLFVAAAGFAGAYLAYEIIRRIPVLRWTVCGI